MPPKQVLRKKKNNLYPQKQQHPGRYPIPDHLPVEEIVIMPEASVEGMKQIGKSVVETLDYIPGSLICRRYIMPKYAPANGEGFYKARCPIALCQKVLPRQAY